MTMALFHFVKYIMDFLTVLKASAKWATFFMISKINLMDEWSLRQLCKEWMKCTYIVCMYCMYIGTLCVYDVRLLTFELWPCVKSSSWVKSIRPFDRRPNYFIPLTFFLQRCRLVLKSSDIRAKLLFTHWQLGGFSQTVNHRGEICIITPLLLLLYFHTIWWLWFRCINLVLLHTKFETINYFRKIINCTSDEKTITANLHTLFMFTTCMLSIFKVFLFLNELLNSFTILDFTTAVRLFNRYCIL